MTDSTDTSTSKATSSSENTENAALDIVNAINKRSRVVSPVNLPEYVRWLEQIMGGPKGLAESSISLLRDSRNAAARAKAQGDMLAIMLKVYEKQPPLPEAKDFTDEQLESLVKYILSRHAQGLSIFPDSEADSFGNP